MRKTISIIILISIVVSYYYFQRSYINEAIQEFPGTWCEEGNHYLGPSPIDGLYPVNYSGRCGYIDKSGKMIIKPRIKEAFGRVKSWRFSEGLAVFKEKGKYGFLNLQGEVVVNPEFEDAENFSEGFAAVKYRGKWGYIKNNKAMVIFPFAIMSEFDAARSFSEGLAAIELNGKWGYINKEGKIVIAPQFSGGVGEFSEGLAAVDFNPSPFNQEVGYIDKSGSVIIPPKFSTGKAFKDRVARVSLTVDEGAFINKKGDIIVEDRDYYLPQTFSEKLLPVEKDGKWGYIDTSGSFAIEPKFSMACLFSEGLAYAEKDGEAGFVNKEGNWIKSEKAVFPVKCLDTRNEKGFSEGLIAVMDREIRKYGYMNTNGRFVIKPVYDFVYPFSDSLAAVVLEGKGFYINKKGEKVFKKEFKWTCPFCEGVARVKDNLGWGYIDKSGRYIWRKIDIIARVIRKILMIEKSEFE